MRCDEFFAIMTDDKADLAKKEAAQAHAATCDDCARVAEGLEGWKEATEHPETVQDDAPWVKESLLLAFDRMEDKKAAATRTPSATARAPSATARTPSARRTRHPGRLSRFRQGLIAAGIALASGGGGYLLALSQTGAGGDFFAPTGGIGSGPLRTLAGHELVEEHLALMEVYSLQGQLSRAKKEAQAVIESGEATESEKAMAREFLAKH